ncbi:MAG TPA: LysR family transcriptional regulator [Candidatus Saccharimonadales bacterium]|nr:LysR family transcriptional regulator [Candidatus Saccharimonadales bacterium]
MKWDDIRLFLAIQRRGTLAGAAQELGLNPTSVGRRLQGAEERLGAALFHRTQDGLVPTAAGASILESAERMDRQARLVEQQILGKDAEIAGVVRVAATSDFATTFLLPRLGRLRAQHPRLRLELVTSPGHVDLSRGEADIAVRFADTGAGPPVGASGPVEILARRLSSAAVGLYASKDYLKRRGRPKSASTLEGHDLIMPIPGSLLPGARYLGRFEQVANPAIRASGLPSVASAAAAGLGICALPAFVAVHHRLVSVGPPAVIETRDVWILYPADLRRTARVTTVRDFIVDVVHDGEAVLAGKE